MNSKDLRSNTFHLSWLEHDFLSWIFDFSLGEDLRAQGASSGLDSEYVLAELINENDRNQQTEMNREVGSLNLDDLVDHKSRLNIKKQTSSLREPLTAETFSILSRANIDSLSFNDKFELLFNDLSMLRASAIRGQLSNTNMRCLAWMIFLGCLPMRRSEWLKELQHKRHVYDRIKEEICCDPHAAPKKKVGDDNQDQQEVNEKDNAQPSDHPLSQTDQVTECLNNPKNVNNQSF